MRGSTGWLGSYQGVYVRDSRNLVPPAPLVRKGFELMATGNHHADDVLRTITALGLRTARGAGCCHGRRGTRCSAMLSMQAG
jgi:hypothetical protein